MGSGLRSPEMIRAILAILRLGHFREVAARKVGIAPSTLSKWISEDPELRRQVEEAEADVEIRALKTVRDRAAGGDSRAAQWLLEKRFRQRWGPRARAEGEGDGKENGSGSRDIAAWFEEGGDDGSE